jgi:Raf kinase inhibitor-like YbhB/YbcL family protein
MNKPLTTIAAVSSALIAGCAGMGMGGSDAIPPGAFRFYSPTYADNTIMPRKHAGDDKSNANCVGDNVSPAFAWENAPPKTRSFALIMDDQAGGSGLGVSHWVAYGIPANVSSFSEGEVTAASPKYVGGSSSRKMAGYFGPCTPKGNAPQHYVFTFIATDLDPKELKPGLTRPELLAAIRGHNLKAASLVLRFVNP